jgi:hypothetical protein
VTGLNTPFTDADELDATALRRHVRKALAAGVAGFLVPGRRAVASRHRKRLFSWCMILSSGQYRKPIRQTGNRISVNKL